jgi:Tfp pilus assembly protein PilN
MRAINLLPSETGRRSRFPRPNLPVLLGVVGSLVVLLVLAAGFVVTGRSEADKRDELAQRESELALFPLPTKPEASTEQNALAAEYAPRVTAVTTALSQRVAWERILHRFSLVLPDDVWLKSLDLKSPGLASGATSSAGTAAKGLSVSGYTYTHDSVARLLTRLALIPDLSNVQLQSSAASELAGRKVVAFTIQADVGPGALSS